MLSTSANKTLSSICRDIAQVCFASMYVGLFVANNFNLPVMFSGLVLSTIFWAVSLSISNSI